jgi:hypothetical protein
MALRWNSEARLLDGLQRYGGGFHWDIPFSNNFPPWTNMRFLLRRDSTDLTYLIYPDRWELNALNSTWNSGVDHRLQRRLLRGTYPPGDAHRRHRCAPALRPGHRHQHRHR